MWIGISGFARSGKDTVADRLHDEYEFQRVVLAAPMKEMIYTLNPIIPNEKDSFERYQSVVDRLGLHEAKNNPEVRRLLQCFGTEVMREQFGKDVWVNLAYEGRDPSLHYVVTDCRYANEADAIVNNGGFIVRVNRPGVGPANDHPSENELTNYDFDYVIENNGTLEDLDAKIDALMDEIRVR